MISQWVKEVHYSKTYSVLGGVVPFLVILSIILRDMLLFSLAVFFILFIFINKWYLNYVTANLVIPYETITLRLFPEEEGEIAIPIENRGKLPIFNGKWGYYLYDHDESVSIIDRDDKDALPSSYKNPFNIPASARRHFKTKVTAVKRGTAQVRTIELIIYDAFKLSSVRLQYQGSFRGEIIVYPTLSPIGHLEKLYLQERGNHTQPFSLYEDVTMTRGTRDYISGDPFNRVNWKATARTGDLQTKVYENVMLSKWTLILNIRGEDYLKPTIENLEEVLSQVAYTARFATTNNISFELFINVKVPGSESGLHLPAGEGKHHLMKTLELLARLRHGQVTILEEAMLYNVFLNRSEKKHAIFHFGAYGQTEDHFYQQAKRSGVKIYPVKARCENGVEQNEQLAT